MTTTHKYTAVLALAEALTARDGTSRELLRFAPAARIYEPLAWTEDGVGVAFDLQPSGWWWVALLRIGAQTLVAKVFEVPVIPAARTPGASLLLGVPTEAEAIRGLVELELERLTGTIVTLDEPDDSDDPSEIVVTDLRLRETCDGEALLRALVQLPDGATLGDPDPEPGTVWGTVRSASKVQLMAAFGCEPVEFTVGERQLGRALLGNVWRRQLLVGPN